MSNLVKKGFTVTYELVDFSSIKVTKKGSNEKISWGESLTCRASNVMEVEDEEVGLVDKEEILEFKFPCESLSEVAELNLLLRTLKNNGVFLTVNGYLPRKYENNPIQQVTVIDTPQDLFKKYHSAMKKPTNNTDNKAS